VRVTAYVTGRVLRSSTYVVQFFRMATRRPGYWFCLIAVGFAPAALGLNPDYKLTQYVHRMWQTQPGSPQTTLFAVAQTKTGDLWLGTETGIVRFDGVRFTSVPELQNASLEDTRARGFAEDSQGRTWIVSNNYGLLRVGGDGVKTFTAADGVPKAD